MSAKPHNPALAHGPSPDVRAGRARVALLGVNAWVVTLLVPSLHLGVDPLGALALGAPLLVLALGLLTLERWTLLAGFPGAIGGLLAWRGDLVEHDAHGPLGIALGALSLLAFVAVAAHASSRERSVVYPQVRLERDPVAEPGARRSVRRALLAATVAGALGITLIAPTLASRQERVALWGEAADDATVLTSIVATLFSCLAVGAVIGPALRASRPDRDHPARRHRRLAAAMLLAVAAGVGWLILRHFDGAAGV